MFGRARRFAHRGWSGNREFLLAHFLIREVLDLARKAGANFICRAGN